MSISGDILVNVQFNHSSFLWLAFIMFHIIETKVSVLIPNSNSRKERGKRYCSFAVVFNWFSLAGGMMPTTESFMTWCCKPAQFVNRDTGTLSL